MDSTNILQLISGQSPSMVLIILLIYQLIREKEAQLKAEQKYGEAIQREQRERIDATAEMNRALVELVRQTVEAITKTGNEMHGLRSKIHESMLSADMRSRGISND